MLRCFFWLFSHLWNYFRIYFHFVYNLFLHYSIFVWYNVLIKARAERHRHKRSRYTKTASAQFSGSFVKGAKAIAHPCDSASKERKVHEMTHTAFTCDIQHLNFMPLSADTCAVAGTTEAHPVCLQIPAYDPDGRLVVEIGDGAFAGLTSLCAVMIPDSVRSVGRRAFAFCSSLEEIHVGRNSQLTHIGNRAFTGCEGLTDLRFGHLRQTLVCETNAFAYCTHLRSVVLPDGMTALGEGMFEGCNRLAHVHLPASLQTVGAAAFSACGSLCYLTLPAHVQFIGEGAFAWCGKLVSLQLPERACVIAASAFRECPARPDFMMAS